MDKPNKVNSKENVNALIKQYGKALHEEQLAEKALLADEEWHKRAKDNASRLKSQLDAAVKEAALQASKEE